MLRNIARTIALPILVGALAGVTRARADYADSEGKTWPLEQTWARECQISEPVDLDNDCIPDLLCSLPGYGTYLLTGDGFVRQLSSSTYTAVSIADFGSPGNGDPDGLPDAALSYADDITGDTLKASTWLGASEQGGRSPNQGGMGRRRLQHAAGGTDCRGGICGPRAYRQAGRQDGEGDAGLDGQPA